MSATEEISESGRYAFTLITGRILHLSEMNYDIIDKKVILFTKALYFTLTCIVYIYRYIDLLTLQIFAAY